jgi:hypothetical protein
VVVPKLVNSGADFQPFSTIQERAHMKIPDFVIEKNLYEQNVPITGLIRFHFVLILGRKKT